MSDLAEDDAVDGGTPSKGMATGATGEDAPARLSRLSLVAAGLARASSAQEVLEIALAQGLSAVGASGATLVVPDGDDLTVSAATGFRYVDVARFSRFPQDSDLPLAEAFRTAQPVWISSAAERRTRYALLADVDTGAHATASVPLVVDRRVVGVLGLAFLFDRRLSASERAFLLSLADVCAPALHRLPPSSASPWELPPAMESLTDARRRAEIRRLGLDSAAVPEAIGLLARAAALLTGAAVAKVVLVDTHERVIAIDGSLPPETPVPVTESLCAVTLARATPLTIPEASAHPWARDLPAVRRGEVSRYLGVPLISREHVVVGVVCVYDDGRDAFPAAGEAILSRLAELAISSCEASAGRDHLDAAHVRAERWRAVATRVHAASTVGELATVVREEVPSLVGARASALLPGARTHHRSGGPADSWHRYRLAGADVPGADVLAVDWDGGVPDDTSVRELSELLGPVVARLRDHEAAERVQMNSEFLAQASRVLDTSLDIEQALRTVARVCVPVLADGCVVRLADADGGLEVVGHAHAEGRLEAQMPLTLKALPPERSGLAWSHRVLRQRRGEFSEPDDETEAALAGGPLAHTGAICVPLVTRGRALGTIWVGRTAPRVRFTSADVTVLEDLAGRAANALDNALLYGELQRAAGDLQRTLLPRRLPSWNDVDVAAGYLAGIELLEVGGDFYDAWSVDAGGRGGEGGDTLWAAVGDVCGRGAQAAALTGVSRHTLRAVSPFVAGPGEALHRLNGALLDVADDDERFVTAVVARLERVATGLRVTLASAAHPYPMVVRADGSVDEVQRDSALLGVWRAQRYEEDVVQLRRGDALVLYTDGVTEAMGLHDQFGEGRLRGILAQCAGGTAQACVRGVQDAVLAFRARGQDDLAILVIASRPTPGHHEEPR